MVRCHGLLALALLQQAQVRTPRIEVRSTEASLILPSAMTVALKKFDPDFTPRLLTDYPDWVWRSDCSPQPRCRASHLYQFSSSQALLAVIGDFNGDGALDVVVDGDNKTTGRRLAIMSSSRAFTVSEISALEHISISRKVWAAARELGLQSVGLNSGMYLVTKRTLRSSYEAKPLVLSADAYEDTVWEKASVVHYYRGGTWWDYITSD